MHVCHMELSKNTHEIMNNIHFRPCVFDISIQETSEIFLHEIMYGNI